MDYQTVLDANAKYGITPADLFRMTLSIEPEQVLPDVILAPWWHPHTLGAHQAIALNDHARVNARAWQIELRDRTVTYLQTGTGAPNVLDVVLTLGISPCRNILFAGSVGGLDPTFRIGDVLVPQYSVSGDGASRYIAGDDLRADPFGQRVSPHGSAAMLLHAAASSVCRRENVAIHHGRTFSTDSILAQLPHMDTILALGCNSIEMETAAAFRAGNLIKRPIAALLCISDLPLLKKSLYTGRSEEEDLYRRRVRAEVLPQIIAEYFQLMDGFHG